MSAPPKLRLIKTPKCSICGKPAAPEHKPFCSRRCADIDLGRWLKEGYRIPASPVTDDEADSVGDQPAPTTKREE